MSYDRMTNLVECLREAEHKLITEFLEDLKYLPNDFRKKELEEKWEKRNHD